MAGIVVGLLILFFLALFLPDKEKDHPADEFFICLDNWDTEQDRDEDGEHENLEDWDESG